MGNAGRIKEEAMSKTITVTGATGTIGTLVVHDLIARGATVRALVHDPEKAGALEAAGAHPVVGGFGDADAVDRVMRGADAALLITPPGPRAAEQSGALIRGARRSGEPHTVRISALRAAADAPTENGRLHHAADEELTRSGLPYTILRPHYFMQNLLASAATIAERRQLYAGMGDGKLGMVDVRDIADVAVSVLLDDGHIGSTYTPTGPSTLSFHEVAAILSAESGVAVEYMAISPAAVRQSILDLGLGEWTAQVLQDYAQAYSDGWGDFITDHVERITGRSPRTFAQFAREVLIPALPSAVE
jgi:uncharacterized protein YbjT (DUF2867 family)